MTPDVARVAAFLDTTSGTAAKTQPKPLTIMNAALKDKPERRQFFADLSVKPRTSGGSEEPPLKKARGAQPLVESSFRPVSTAAAQKITTPATTPPVRPALQVASLEEKAAKEDGDDSDDGSEDEEKDKSHLWHVHRTGSGDASAQELRRRGRGATLVGRASCAPSFRYRCVLLPLDFG
jgi:hypothetical protein